MDHAIQLLLPITKYTIFRFHLRVQTATWELHAGGPTRNDDPVTSAAQICMGIDTRLQSPWQWCAEYHYGERLPTLSAGTREVLDPETRTH